MNKTFNSPYKSYELTEKEGQVGIKCRFCGKISWNENDVKFKYCGYCHKFHTEGGEKK